jgi:hypothetical protein
MPAAAVAQTATETPTTTILGTDVVISWQAPADGGSTITSYIVINMHGCNFYFNGNFI